MVGHTVMKATAIDESAARESVGGSRPGSFEARQRRRACPPPERLSDLGRE